MKGMTEREKYSHLWKNGYKRSKTAEPFADFISRIAEYKWKLLDIGCGDGLSLSILRGLNFDCYGADITLEGMADNPDKKYCSECPAEKLIFKDDEYDMTFSTDVLEHVPAEKIDDAIKEIIRVTRIRTVHCIANWKDERDGAVLHHIRQSREWWKNKFQAHNKKGIDILIFDREEFLNAQFDI